MIHKIKKMLFHTLVPAVLAVLMIPTVSFAAVPTCTVSIPVEVKVEVKRGSVPAEIQYKLELEAVTPGAPMPEVTELTINKDGEKTSFGPITYTIPEDYKYMIRQKFEETNYFTFDAAEYTVTVRVLNDDNGGVYAVFWVGDAQTTDKPTEIAFTNTYYKPGGGSGSDGPSGGGGTPTTSGGPGTTTITDAEAPTATILPFDVPLALPQTGTLWWLVPILAITGVIMFFGGMLKGRKADEDEEI